MHGDDHWRAVALVGLYIAGQTPGADLDFIVAFAQLHDVMRENDGADPLHGARGAQLLAGLLEEPGIDGFAPNSQRARDLLFAISHHTDTENARDHPNVNVGICWDADRVNLWRVWKRPSRRFMTTTAAIDGDAIDYGRELCLRQRRGDLPNWGEIIVAYNSARRTGSG